MSDEILESRINDVSAVIDFVQTNSKTSNFGLDNLTLLGIGSGGLAVIETSWWLKDVKYTIAIDPEMSLKYSQIIKDDYSVKKALSLILTDSVQDTDLMHILKFYGNCKSVA